jgi:hypothetical protein
MIVFSLSIDYNFRDPYILFSSSSQRDEWKILTGVFDGHIKLEYFKSLSAQFEEIISRQRVSLEEDDKVVPSPNPGTYCVLEVDTASTEIIDLENNQQLRLRTTDFKKLIDNWIKFVEVNTAAFSTKNA